MERIARRPVLVVTLLATAGVCAAIVASEGVQSGAAAGAGLVLAFAAAVVSIAESHTASTAAASTGRDLVSVLGRELERSRRHKHTLAVVRIPLVEHGSLGAGGTHLAAIVAAGLRAIDDVVADGDSLYLILSETDGAEARNCVRRLVARHPEVFTDTVARYAAFPRDGVTLSALLATLDGRGRVADHDDLPSLDRRRRVALDLTAVNRTVVDAIGEAVAPASLGAEADTAAPGVG